MPIANRGLVVSISLLIGGVLVVGGLSWGPRFSTDSAFYVEAATSLLEGRGLSTRLWGGLSPEPWQPLTLWPPGYPVLVAGTTVLGLPPPTSALLVATVSLVVVLVFIALWLERLLPLALACAAAALVSSMYSLSHTGAMAWSDAPHLAAVLASLWCLLRWSNLGRPVWALSAGLLAGIAFSFRYLGIAMMPTIAAFVLLEGYRGDWPRARRAAVLSATGFSLVGVPILVRNLRVFGELNPYDQPASETTAWELLMQLPATLLAEIMALRGREAVPLPLVLTFGGLVVLTIVGWLFRQGGRRLLRDLFENRAFVLLLLFATSYTGFTIWAIAHYRNREGLSARYLVPVSWIALALACAVVAVILRRRGWHGATWVVVGLLLLGAAGQLLRSSRMLSGHRRSVLSIDAEVARRLAETIDSDRLVLATRSDALRVHGRLQARQLPRLVAGSAASRLDREEISTACDSGLLWGLVVEDVEEVRRGAFGTIIEGIVADPATHGFRRLDIGGDAYVLECSGDL